MLSVISPANHTVIRNGTMTVTLNASEPVVGLLLLLPGSSTWAAVSNIGDTSSSQAYFCDSKRQCYHRWLALHPSEGGRPIE
jgi:hypothetical protein